MSHSTFPALLAVCLLGGDASAQGLRFGVQSSLVVLSATAVDGKGRPVSDLRPEELKIFEEGRPQKLGYFSHSRESALRILVLVDASGSMNGQLKAASSQMAVVQMLAALGPQDEIALAGFDSRYFGVVPFTRERERILTGLKELAPFGGTALHDGLDKAAYDLASHGEGRRAVVVITDGIDTVSEKAPEDVIARSKALDVPIYAVSVLSPLDDPDSPFFSGKERSVAATKGRDVLMRYASMSGGAAFGVSDFKGLRAASEKIVGELKHQYRLGYDPPAGPARFRRIEVRSTRKGVSVRTRSGYVPSS